MAFPQNNMNRLPNLIIYIIGGFFQDKSYFIKALKIIWTLGNNLMVTSTNCN